MLIALESISIADLQVLAVSGIPAKIASRVADGALPPHFVAARSLAQINEGKSVLWCSTFYIVRPTDNFIVGGCGFKDIPSNGRVAIGYAVAPAYQSRGFATAAIQELIRLAFASEAVNEVLAEVSLTNSPSLRLVQKLNFEKSTMRIDEDNEQVIQWILRKRSNVC